MCKLPQTIRGFLIQSAIVFLAMYTTSIHLTSAVIVHVNYTSPEIPDIVMPEELNFTLHAESGGSPIHISLTRVQHTDQHIPVYTYTVGQDGKHIYKREQLADNKNIGYYQDVSNEAAIQVTRSDSQGDEEGHLYMKGELNIAGEKYMLTPGRRFKRDRPLFNESGSSTQTLLLDSGESYDLLPQINRPVLLHDYILAPPELLRKIEASIYEVPKSLLAPLSSDSPFSSKPTSSQQPSFKRLRRQEQVAQNFYIDVVAVADFAIYSRFLADSGSRTETLQAMREYYAFIFNGVDLRYKNIASVNYVIHVRLIRLIITETAAAGSFTEKFRVTNRPWDEVDAQNVLSSFSEYAAGPGREMLFPYDHVMLFTGYDLTSVQSPSTITNATTGLAFTSTLCRMDGKSASVVEDLGGFQSVDTAAHELGHSLSAQHDGDGNTCSSADRYIMASGSRPVTDRNRFNPWIFSPCSIASFTTFINNELRTTRGATCLRSNLTINTGIPDVSNRLPGQEFLPDDQCRMIYGSASRFCRGIEFTANGNICTSMFCFDSSTAGICYEQTAAMGTTCGDGKLCLDGHCVLDSRAPSVDENCVFGDQPGPAFDGVTCPDFVNSYIGYCYQSLVRGRCCSSCKNVYRTVTGCEYGDKVRGCTPQICSYSATNYLEQCCGTCNYGAHFTLPSTTMRVSQNSRPTSQTADILTTPQSMTNMLNIDSATCEDNPRTLINGLRCAVALAANPKLCSETQVSIHCCASCDKATTGAAGREFGGREEHNFSEEVEENDEKDEKSSLNYLREDENEKAREEELNTFMKEEEERNEIENAEVLEGEDERNNADQEEMMAKSSAALFIHITPDCGYGDQYPIFCKQAKSCDGIINECCQNCSTTVNPTNETAIGLSTAAPTTSCIDQHNVLVNNMTCATAIRQFPFYCYTKRILSACCLSCKQKHVGVKDCEYGDHIPQRCNSTLSASDCHGLGDDCCFTCSSSSAPRNIAIILHHLLMVLSFHIFTSVLSRSTSLL